MTIGGPGRRLGRAGRRAERWSSPHERATVRAAERLDGPLESVEAVWLDEHLAGCETCRAKAEAYLRDRIALRRLRDAVPEPPRDLWARTAAGIERDAGARRRARTPGRPWVTSAPALGLLSGVAVVGVVVVAMTIAGGFFGPTRPVIPDPSVAVAGDQVGPPGSDIAVGPGKVRWLGSSADGGFAYNVASIDRVCPFDPVSVCAPIEDPQAKSVALSATPRFVYQSPVDDQAVVVGTDVNGADAVLVIALPTPDPTPAGEGSAAPDGSEAVAGGPDGSPLDTGPPADSPPPVTIPSSDLQIAPPVEIASPSPDSTAPTVSEPSPGTAMAILTDVTIVGRAAAYSPDGTWFAFSARPADGSAGPDIYAWHVGEAAARPLTGDHGSVFASWVGGLLLGSRLGPEQPIVGPLVTPTPAPDSSAGASLTAGTPQVRTSTDVSAPIDAPGVSGITFMPDALAAVGPFALIERLPQTFLIDPATGAEVATLEPEWQPAVDPTGLAVLAWQGTVSVGEGGRSAAPATGELVIHAYRGPRLNGERSIDSPSPDATQAASPTSTIPPTASLPSAAVSGSPVPSVTPEVVRDFPTLPLLSGPVAGFHARWDETGTWLALWIADPEQPDLGRLSLIRFDRATGSVDRPAGAPQEVTALPGFSIGYGRLAWASPPGEEGEGSRIQVAAWTADGVGAIESVPVEGAIVVQ